MLLYLHQVIHVSLDHLVLPLHIFGYLTKILVDINELIPLYFQSLLPLKFFGFKALFIDHVVDISLDNILIFSLS